MKQGKNLCKNKWELYNKSEKQLPVDKDYSALGGCQPQKSIFLQHTETP